MGIKALHDRMVVKRDAEETVSEGGIALVGAKVIKPMFGTVVEVGPGKLSDSGVLLEPEVKIGDRVLFGKFAGNDVTIDGEELLILREEDILAVIEDSVA